MDNNISVLVAIPPPPNHKEMRCIDNIDIVNNTTSKSIYYYPEAINNKLAIENEFSLIPEGSTIYCIYTLDSNAIYKCILLQNDKQTKKFVTSDSVRITKSELPKIILTYLAIRGISI